MFFDEICVHLRSVTLCVKIIDGSKSAVLKNLDSTNAITRRKTPDSGHVVEVRLKEGVVYQFLETKWQRGS